MPQTQESLVSFSYRTTPKSYHRSKLTFYQKLYFSQAKEIMPPDRIQPIHNKNCINLSQLASTLATDLFPVILT